MVVLRSSGMIYELSIFFNRIKNLFSVYNAEDNWNNKLSAFKFYIHLYSVIKLIACRQVLYIIVWRSQIDSAQASLIYIFIEEVKLILPRQVLYTFLLRRSK